jgi:hypothetical protein
VSRNCSRAALTAVASSKVLGRATSPGYPF